VVGIGKDIIREGRYEVSFTKGKHARLTARLLLIAKTKSSILPTVLETELHLYPLRKEKELRRAIAQGTRVPEARRPMLSVADQVTFGIL